MSKGKTLREALEAQAHLWRQMAEPEPDDDASDKAGREAIGGCATGLTQILGAHPNGQPAKVIIVTEANGRDRHYLADSFDGDTSGLDVSRDGHVIASYPGEHSWLNAREDGAEVPDSTDRALRIAKKALEEIARRAADGGEKPFGRPEIGGIARDALEDIFTEIEL